jgi:hypothetical protein
MNSSDERLDESQPTDKSRPTEQSGTEQASKRRDGRGERAQREAAVTTPCSPGQPAGGE